MTDKDGKVKDRQAPAGDQPPRGLTSCPASVDVKTLSLASAFSTDVLRLFVVPEPQESWVPQFVVGRPLGETDLGNEVWFHPMYAASWQALVAKGTHGRLQLRQFSTQPL